MDRADAKDETPTNTRKGLGIGAAKFDRQGGRKTSITSRQFFAVEEGACARVPSVVYRIKATLSACVHSAILEMYPHASGVQRFDVKER